MTSPLNAQDDILRARQDYERLRAAYLQIARQEPGHEVGLAMVGADMDRAHARLQLVSGLRPLASSHEPSATARPEAERVSQENA